tara:strand:- start:2063 stop:3343 length:1281 start_codon:yes stop_codon:yes gene_type:complete
MTYQTAYKLLVAAYKSAKGIMPEGLDLLKIKQKARQKVIDAKKVIEFPKERITNPFKPRPTETEIMMKKTGIPVTVKGKTTTMTPDNILKMLMDKGKGKDVKIGQAPKTTKRKPTVDPKLTQEENIKRIMAENKAAAKRLQEKMNKPEKSLGEKLKDYDGDPDGMAGGGKVKKPFGSKVVDFLGGPAVVGAELGLSGLLEVYNLLGMPLMKDGGIMELATGGMTNISDTYDNNPTLQSQYPNKQDYLDLFAQQTTTTTPQTNTATQSTTSTIAPINPIKPIIPIPQSSGDSGGITTIQPRAPKEDLTFRESMAKLNLQRGVPVEEEENKFGIMDVLNNPAIKYNPLNPMFQFNAAKAALSKGKEKALDIIQAIKDKQAAKELAKLQAQRDRLTYSGPAFTNQDGSTISQDFSTPAGLSNYDADVLR